MPAIAAPEEQRLLVVRTNGLLSETSEPLRTAGEESGGWRAFLSASTLAESGDRALKVLYVIDSLCIGGAESLLLPLAHTAPARGFTFDVLSLAPELVNQKDLVDRLRATGLKQTTVSIRGLADPQAIPRLTAAIRQSGCDLVHAHLQYSVVLASTAARFARRPSVCTLHHLADKSTGREAIKERMAVAIGGRSRALIFVSSAAMDAFAARYRPNRRTWTVVPNGIDLSHFVPEAATFPTDLEIPSDAPAAVLVGSMRGRKGHADAVRAWPQVATAVPGARLLFVGAGPEEARLRVLANELGVSHLVTFAGTRADVARIMRASALVLLPSEAEALPTVLMEAAACGRPVIATAVGGIPELVHDGETGVLVPVADVASLARATVELFSDADRRRKMGSAARMLAEEQFGVEAWSDRLHSLYRLVLSGRSVVPAHPARMAGNGP